MEAFPDASLGGGIATPTSETGRWGPNAYRFSCVRYNPSENCLAFGGSFGPDGSFGPEGSLAGGGFAGGASAATAGAALASSVAGAAFAVSLAGAAFGVSAADAAFACSTFGAGFGGGAEVATAVAFGAGYKVSIGANGRRTRCRGDIGGGRVCERGVNTAFFLPVVPPGG